MEQKSDSPVLFGLGVVVGLLLGTVASICSIYALSALFVSERFSIVLWPGLILAGLALGVWGLRRLRFGLNFLQGLTIAAGLGFMGPSLLCGWVVGFHQ